MNVLDLLLKDFELNESLLLNVKTQFERAFTDILKAPVKMCLLFDYSGLDSNSSTAPWYQICQHLKIDGELIRRGLILATSIVQVNAAKAYVDLNVLNFYLTEKQNLFNSIETLLESRTLNKEEIAFLFYINDKMKISRLSDYE